MSAASERALPEFGIARAKHNETSAFDPQVYNVDRCTASTMPFRAKMKRALGRTNSSSTGSDLTQTETSKSSKSKKPKKEKLPDNVYKPGEAMPRLKYRGPVNKEHEANLKAFSFGDILKRRRSTATGNSDISPMGSRVMSRRGSAWSKRSKLGSRQNSGFKDVEEGELDDESHVENGTSR